MPSAKTFLCFLSLSALVVLSGCKNDRDAVSYDDIGETRVYETPRVATHGSRYINESVPAPAPLTPAYANKHPRAASSNRHGSVGEMIPE